MLIKAMIIDIHIPHANSLKDKRKVIKSIRQKIKNKFNVSISELENLDLHRRSSLGIAMVGNDKVYLEQNLDKIIDFIYDNYQVEILDIVREDR